MHSLSFSVPLSLLAQTDGDAGGLGVQSIWDFMVKGGPMMIPIVACSFVALAVTIERFFSLRHSAVIPPNFFPGLREALGSGDLDKKKAKEYCERNPSPVAKVMAAGIKRLGQPIELLERHIEEFGQRELFKLRKFLRVLSVIASITPLMGLLGTILGMIKAFQTVATSGEALGKTELLAEGIYEAMITTAAGLLVAIPVLIMYHWVSAKVDRLVGEIDLISVEFIEDFALPTLSAKTAQLPPASSNGKDGSGDLPRTVSEGVDQPAIIG